MGDKPPGRIEIGIGDGFIEGHLTGARSNPCSAVPWVRSRLRLPIGGNTTLAFTGELRARVHGNFSAVGFLDGGNVWERSSQVDLSTLVYAIGAGLRYQTVVGPIRFDYGYQLTPIEGLVVNGELRTASEHHI